MATEVDDTTAATDHPVEGPTDSSGAEGRPRSGILGDPELATRALTAMWRTRLFEEAVDDLFARGLMHGTMHLSIGQEASSTGVCLALKPGDQLTSTHRGHGHCIAAGADLTRMMAELLAKDTGYCRGRGGSMHIADVATGNLGANGIVGGGIPIAVGAALGLRLQGREGVVVSFFGDGAANEGAFHEGVNLAAVWDLPVLFVCENNKYGMSMSTSLSMRVDSVADRASAYGIEGRSVDGNDVVAVHAAATEAVDRARETGKPTLLETVTYRWKGHSKSDKNLYRTKEEIAEWKERDPLIRFAAALQEAGTLDKDAIDGIAAQARKDIRAAVREANDAEPSRPDVLLDAVYAVADPSDGAEPLDMTAGTLEDTGTDAAETRVITYAEAIREALGQAMEADERVFLLGEDIGVYGGAFGVSGDLFHRFGPERVRDTPISELGIVGAAVGAALVGSRPVVEIQFSDFTCQAMDQIVNQAAKIHFMLGGEAQVPMVLRAPGGSGTGAAAQHSQSLEAWFAHVPGLKVVMPATAADAKGLLLSAIDDPNPVIVLEHKLLYRTKGEVPEDAVRVPLGKAAVRREGGDVSIVATGVMVQRSLEAADALAEQGVDCTVVDVRCLKPLDTDTILATVRATGRVLLVQEAPRSGGFMAEVAACIAESDALYHLLAPIGRLCGLDVPIPYAPELEKAAVPQVDDIVTRVTELVRSSHAQ